MIQHYLDLCEQVKNCSEAKLAGGQIQKIYSTAFYIAISIRTPGKTYWLYLGRGSGHEGIWLGSSPPVSILRQKDAFLEYLRKYLVSKTFVEITLNSTDRIIKINYQSYGQLNSILFFWMGRKLYFSHHYLREKDQARVNFFSWRDSEKDDLLNQDYFQYFEEVGGGRLTDLTTKNPNSNDIVELLKEEESLIRKSPESEKKNFLVRKEKNIEDDLRKTQQWKKLESLLSKRKDFAGHELVVEDHKIKFQSGLNDFEKRNLIFEKIKKLKKGEKILLQRLAEVKELKSAKKSGESSVSKIEIVKPVWRRDKKGEHSTNNRIYEVKKNDFVIFNVDDFQLAVGLNSSGNDQLRNSWASKNDIWFHLDGYTSSHLILKNSLNVTIQVGLIEKIATILAYYSQFKSDLIPVVYTEIRNLRGVSGAQGMVTFKKEKRLLCRRNIEFEKTIKEER